MKDNVSGLQAHCSPLQAPLLEYQCSSGGNSSRTAIRKKNNNNSILLQKDRMLLQTCAGPHMDRHIHKHNHKVCTVQIFIIIYPISSFTDASDLKSMYCMCHFCLLQQICTAPKRQGHMSHILLYISELEQYTVIIRTIKAEIHCGKTFRHFPSVRLPVQPCKNMPLGLQVKALHNYSFHRKWAL